MLSAKQTEDDGITAFKNFISPSKIIDASNIKVGDRYPTIDGGLILYNRPDHNGQKKYIEDTIPIQVKSVHRKPKEKDSFPMTREDLENYLIYGGVLFIRPNFITTTEYAIFIQLILPRDIREILNNHNFKTKNIKLERVNKIADFEILVKHFATQRRIQFNYLNMDRIPKIVDTQNRFILNTVVDPSVPESFFRHAYLCYEDSQGCLIPTSLKLIRFIKKHDFKILIGRQVFYDHLSIEIEEQGIKKRYFDSVLSVELTQSNLTLRWNINDESLLGDVKKLFDFIECIEKVKSLNINGVITEKDIISEGFFTIADREKWISLFSFLAQFKYDLNKIKVKDVNAKYKMIFNLVSILLFNGTLQVTDNDNEINLYICDLFYKKIVLILKKITGNTYSGKDLFSIDELVNIQVQDENGNKISCSRFIGLVKTTGNTPENASLFFDFKEDILKDICKYYDQRIQDFYTDFVLFCLGGYDKYKNSDLLELAEDTLHYLESNSSKELLDIVKINMFQCFKRRKQELTDKQIKELLKIDERNPNNIKMKCCIRILLDRQREFKILFEELATDEQEIFKTWPIWNLIKNET